MNVLGMIYTNNIKKRVFFRLAWKIFLKSMMESEFRKSLGLYVNSDEGVYAGVCF